MFLDNKKKSIILYCF